MDRPDEQRNPFLVEGLKALVGLLEVNRTPQMKDAVAAIKRAVARAALELSSGNIQVAADLVGTSRRTIHRAANDNSVPALVDLWDNGAMSGPFNDTLFPFIRVMWPHDADAAFVDEQFAWWMSDVVPRATAEGTKFVSLANFAAFSSGLPPKSVVDAMMAHKDEYLAHVGPWQLATVIFSPKVPLGVLFAPIINICPFETKLATTPGKAISLAKGIFDKAGVQTPALELN